MLRDKGGVYDYLVRLERGVGGEEWGCGGAAGVAGAGGGPGGISWNLRCLSWFNPGVGPR